MGGGKALFKLEIELTVLENTVWSGVSFICNAVLSPREYDFEYDFEYEVNTYQQTQITYFI